MTRGSRAGKPGNPVFTHLLPAWHQPLTTKRKQKDDEKPKTK